MRSLMLHANIFATRIIEQSNWPEGIQPEEKKTEAEEMKKCLVVFFCVENGDSDEQLDGIYKEILKASKELKTKNVLISPFVHLSNNIAQPDIAKKLYEQLMDKFVDTDYTVQSSHFGYHKSLLLDIKGHPGAFRYREF